MAKKIDATRLALFGGGIGQATGKPPRPPRNPPISQSMPIQLQQIAKGSTAADNSSRTTGVRPAPFDTTRKAGTLNTKPSSGESTRDREKRKAMIVPRTTTDAMKTKWNVDPNPDQFRNWQLKQSEAKTSAGVSTIPTVSSNGKIVPVNSTYGKMTPVHGHPRENAPTSGPYGKMIPVDSSYGHMIPIQGHSQQKAPFGHVVSRQIAADHRINQAPRSDNKQRRVIFKNLLTVKEDYIGEKVLYAAAPEEYKITINKDTGLLVDTRGEPVTATDAKFVVNEYGDWFMAKIHADGILHHSFFTRGGPVAMAGYMTAKNGQFYPYVPWSGHYHPRPEHVDQFEKYLSSTNLKRSAAYVAPQACLLPEDYQNSLPADYKNDSKFWNK